MTHTNGSGIDKQARQVIFGSGPLGLAVMDALTARGYTNITVVNRRGAVDETLPAGVSVVAGDATDPDDVARITEGAAVVFQCAQPGYAEWPEKFPPIIEGIVAGVSRTGARLIFGDNLYMYGPTGGAAITEDLPYAATGRKGRTRAGIRCHPATSARTGPPGYSGRPGMARRGHVGRSFGAIDAGTAHCLNAYTLPGRQATFQLFFKK